MYRIYDDKPTLHQNWHSVHAVNKPVIYMQHGLLGSSDDFVLSTIERAPAFIAASAGYDVWLGNTRGNRYSREHIDWNPNHDEAYWEFSFAEMGKFDIPAFISYIAEETNILFDRRKITLVAYDQGATAAFYGITKNPEYFEEHINLLVALSPIVLIDDMKPWLAEAGRIAL
jgi:pimeloyl-ACP methyl ester carboxylesterase